MAETGSSELLRAALDEDAERVKELIEAGHRFGARWPKPDEHPAVTLERLGLGILIYRHMGTLTTVPPEEWSNKAVVGLIEGYLLTSGRSLLGSAGFVKFLKTDPFGQDGRLAMLAREKVYEITMAQQKWSKRILFETVFGELAKYLSPATVPEVLRHLFRTEHWRALVPMMRCFGDVVTPWEVPAFIMEAHGLEEETGWTWAHWFAYAGKTQAFKGIQLPEDVINHKAHGGLTPLHLAVAVGEYETALHLLEHCGADPRIGADNGRTIMYTALSTGDYTELSNPRCGAQLHLQLAHALLDGGAPPTAPPEWALQPLGLAARFCSMEPQWLQLLVRMADMGVSLYCKCPTLDLMRDWRGLRFLCNRGPLPGHKKMANRNYLHMLRMPVSANGLPHFPPGVHFMTPGLSPEETPSTLQLAFEWAFKAGATAEWRAWAQRVEDSTPRDDLENAVVMGTHCPPDASFDDALRWVRAGGDLPRQGPTGGGRFSLAQGAALLRNLALKYAIMQAMIYITKCTTDASYQLLDALLDRFGRVLGVFSDGQDHKSLVDQLLAASKSQKNIKRCFRVFLAHGWVPTLPRWGTSGSSHLSRLLRVHGTCAVWAARLRPLLEALGPWYLNGPAGPGELPPLALAIREELYGVVAVLVEAGADPDVTMPDGRPLLQVMRESGGATPAFFARVLSGEDLVAAAAAEGFLPEPDCVVCYEARPDMLSRCGHLCCCEACTRIMFAMRSGDPGCLKCREPMEGSVKVPMPRE